MRRRHHKDETGGDGDNAEKLLVGDRVVIRRAQADARICRLSNEKSPRYWKEDATKTRGYAPPRRKAGDADENETSGQRFWS